MSLRPEPLPPIPDTTAAAVRAAFPKGNLYVDLRTEFGTLYHDQLFADLYPPEGRPVEVAPWRLALVMVMQYIEGLTDRQAADAVRRCMDWKYALSLDLHDPGFDFTLLHDFRERLLAHEAAQRLLDTFLAACKTRGWIKPRGTQRTDSTHVLAAIRRLYYLECVQEALRHALNQLSEVNASWVHQHVPVAWYERYGPRAEVGRFPKEASKREALAVQIGADGYHLLEWLGADEHADDLRRLPAVEVLRQIWVQHYYRCTVPGLETLRWRSTDEQPPAALLIQSPYDVDARYSQKRETQWVGYKVHLSETCDVGRGVGKRACHKHLFKEDLQALVNDLEVPIRVAHYPAYCSKFNPIERRLFSHVTRACQGILFDSLHTVMGLIQKTKTQQGLSVTVRVLDKLYEGGRTVSEAFKKHMPIVFDTVLPKWNYWAMPQ